MNQLFPIIVLFLLLEEILFCQPSIQTLNTLKDKVGKVKSEVKVVKESRRGVSINFIPRNEILYPGLDRLKKDKVNQLWQDYYECQEALYGSTMTLIVPEAIAVHDGSNIILECEVCESPRDIFLDTKWLFAADYSMNSIIEVKYSATVYMTNDSLHISNIQEAAGGLYVCQRGIHFARPYILHVFKEELSKKVVPEQNNEGEHPAPDVHIPKLGVTVTTRWADWTQCSRCDLIGQRHRQGICTVIADTNLQKYRRKRKTYQPYREYRNDFINSTADEIEEINQSTESLKTSNLTTENNGSTTDLPLEKHQNITTGPIDIYSNISIKDDLELLNMFEDGIPCRSKLLSNSLQSIAELSNRSSEVLIAYCKISCPKSVLFVVLDEKGNVVETANNSGGVYSVLQGLPQELPDVSRTVEFATYNKFFKIQCPGNRNMDIPVEWFVGHKALTNKILENETNGRIKIDEYNRITFSPALMEDSRVFSCWQHRKLAGTVRLLVEEKYDLNYDRLIMIIGIIVVFAIFIYVYYKAFTLF